MRSPFPVTSGHTELTFFFFFFYYLLCFNVKISYAKKKEKSFGSSVKRNSELHLIAPYQNIATITILPINCPAFSERA